LICPICGTGVKTKYALSRYDNKTNICDLCGQREAKFIWYSHSYFDEKKPNEKMKWSLWRSIIANMGVESNEEKED
jgi:hypothetical protein